LRGEIGKLPAPREGKVARKNQGSLIEKGGGNWR